MVGLSLKVCSKSVRFKTWSEDEPKKYTISVASTRWQSK
uniref:Uncharacterized protein n=1 Tax=Anguilla anguilla TaxID=7936 RepID=A0A0E9TVH2_ANGAN